MGPTVAAERLFREFHGREPTQDDIARIDMRGPETVLVIGELDGLIYRAEDSAEPYIHRFKKSDRPLLLCSSDGRQLYILKGGYRFTDRGIIG